MIRKTLFIITLITVTWNSFSQQLQQDEIDEFLEEFILEEEEDILDQLLKTTEQKHYIYSSLNFNSNTYFAGRLPEGTSDQISFTPQVMYLNTNGIFGGVSGLYLDNQDPKWDVTILSAGYGKKVNQKGTLRFSSSYSRFIFSDDSNAVFKNVIDAGLMARTKNRIIGGSFNTSFLFGEESTLQATFRIFSQIKLIDKTTWDLRIRPRISLLGSIQEVATSVDTFIEEETENEFLAATGTEDKFKFFNTTYYLPIQLNTGNWDFEAGFLLNVPIERDSLENDLPSRGLFQLSVGYFFGL